MHDLLGHLNSPSCVLTGGILLAVWNEVDQGEDDDPDDIHKVPVQTRDLQRHGVLGLQSATEANEEQAEQPQNAQPHVESVESGKGEERATEDVGLKGQALVVELGELEELATKERATQQGRSQQ